MNDAIWDRISQHEKKTVRQLGERIGFGRIMQLANICWQEALEKKGMPRDGAHSIGPCLTFLVDCGCEDPVKCDWCCATGKLTRNVKKIKDEVGS